MCSNKHLHLLKYILNDKRMQEIDFNIPDWNGQTPFQCALRQYTSAYALLLISVVEKNRTKSLPDLKVFSKKHGHPLHIAILSKKFDVALKMLKLAPKYVDHSVFSQIGANVMHLLFVKYEEDCQLAYKILTECMKLKNINPNLIDDL